MANTCVCLCLSFVVHYEQSSNNAFFPGQETSENKWHPEIPLSQNILVGLHPPSLLGSVTARSEEQMAKDGSIS